MTVDTQCGPRVLSKGANGVAVRTCLTATPDGSGGFECGTCRAVKFPLSAEGRAGLMVERGVARRLHTGMSQAWPPAATHIVQADRPRPGTDFMSMELITPAVEGVFTLFDLIAWSLGSKRGPAAAPVSAVEWKSVMLQVLGTLAELRRVVPRFQHNDLHLKNVMLAAWPADAPRQIFRSASGRVLEAPRGRFCAKIIDFGQATSDLPEIFTEEGRTVWGAWLGCGAIDLVRVAGDAASIVAGTASASVPSWLRDWVTFVASVLTPPAGVPRNGPFVNRPHAEGGIHSFPSVGTFANVPEAWFRASACAGAAPESLLDAPYFAEFVVPA